MKVYYQADLDPRPFEGRTTISLKLKQFLQQEGCQFVDKPEEADLIHIHSSGVMQSYTAYQLKKKYEVPVLYSLYSNSQTEIINHFRNHWLQRKVLEKGATNWLLSYSAILPLKWRGIFLKKLDAVIVPSNYLKNRLFDNAIIIKFDIDTKKFKPLKKEITTKVLTKKDPEKNQDHSSSKIKVAFFGHPGVFKGQTDFVQASRKFSSQIEPYMFFTKRSEKTDTYIQQNNPQIQIRGYVDDIVKAYHGMDIIVLPYRNPLGAIANPLILLEAMVCEKAIIPTNLFFIKEIGGEAAITVNPYNPQAIAEKVNWLAEHPEVRQSLGQAARQRILAYHDQKQMFDSYLQLYQKFENKKFENKKLVENGISRKVACGVGCGLRGAAGSRAPATPRR